MANHFCDLAPNKNPGIGIVAPACAPGFRSGTHLLDIIDCPPTVAMYPCQNWPSHQHLLFLHFEDVQWLCEEFQSDPHFQRMQSFELLSKPCFPAGLMN